MKTLRLLTLLLVVATGCGPAPIRAGGISTSPGAHPPPPTTTAP